jgi:hypothetical protein
MSWRRHNLSWEFVVIPTRVSVVYTFILLKVKLWFEFSNGKWNRNKSKETQSQSTSDMASQYKASRVCLEEKYAIGSHCGFTVDHWIRTHDGNQCFFRLFFFFITTSFQDCRHFVSNCFLLSTGVLCICFYNVTLWKAENPCDLHSHTHTHTHTHTQNLSLHLGVQSCPHRTDAQLKYNPGLWNTALL